MFSWLRVILELQALTAWLWYNWFILVQVSSPGVAGQPTNTCYYQCFHSVWPCLAYHRGYPGSFNKSRQSLWISIPLFISLSLTQWRKEHHISFLTISQDLICTKLRELSPGTQRNMALINTVWFIRSITQITGGTQKKTQKKPRVKHFCGAAGRTHVVVVHGINCHLFCERSISTFKISSFLLCLHCLS